MANEVLTLQKLADISKEIVDTLPIAHYLRVSTIPVSFSTTDQTSYFDHNNFTIVVAFNNILQSVMNKASNNNNQIDNVDLEKTIRGLLYHEISHAILTPNGTKEHAYNMHQAGAVIDHNLMNIIEDERIETILKHYYMNVDFKENLRSIVKLENAQNFEHFVFNAVRFRYCPIKQKEVNDAIKAFIERTKRINATSYAGTLAMNANALCVYLKSVYEEWLSLNNANQNSQTQQNQKSSNSQSEEQDNGNGAQNKSALKSEEESDANSDGDSDSNQESKSNKIAEKESAQQNANEHGSSASQPSESDCESDELTDNEIEEMQKAMEDAINSIKRIAQSYGTRKLLLSDFVYDNDTFVNLYKIIIKNQGFGNKQSPIRFGYCGALNAKRFMKDHNESYKWFEKKTFDDANKGNKQAKKILNIFLDNSGSFRGNDYEVNKILSALQTIEHKVKNFEFRLIRWGSWAARLTGEDRMSESCDGSTRLESSFVREFGNANQTKQEYNIFLTDGGIQSGFENMVLFNNKRSIIISQEANVAGMKRLCPNCRAIITENQDYATQLKHNVAKALDALF